MAKRPMRGGGLGFKKKLAIGFLLVALAIGLLSAAAPWVDHLWDPETYPNPNQVVETETPTPEGETNG